MAYTPDHRNTMSIPVEPIVISMAVDRSTGNLDYPVKVPWKECRLAYAYVITTTVVATADWEIDLELNAAGGTEMMTATVATSGSAVGDVTEFTVSSAAACKDLDRDDTARDVVNIESTLHASGAAAGTVFMYFEPNSLTGI